MGRAISGLRTLVERWAGNQPHRLRAGGALITVLVVTGSSGLGWLLERLLVSSSPLPLPMAAILLVLALASALAARSLRDSVLAVVQALPDLESAREKLNWIVGRDVSELNQREILRASAETASENAVDGLFAPLFWMLVGAGLWQAGFTQLPGPLALAWGFKATSTIDSMLGYRHGSLRWLGTAGARLDDLLTWLPCRLVLVTLPLVSVSWKRWAATVEAAQRDGRPDPSPNAGLSEAIFAHCAGVRMGGLNRYGENWIQKPLLSAHSQPATAAGVRTVLNLGLRLEFTWLVLATGWLMLQ